MMPTARDIARAFLPRRPHYYYAWSKLATDPLYVGAADALRHAQGPLLDLGCGIGLLAHALRAQNVLMPYRGVDVDKNKIESAKAAAIRAPLSEVDFEVVDLGARFPDHRGSVSLLDVLQFLAPERHAPLIEAALDCLTPGACLVIRTGLHRDNWRMRITRSVDHLSRWWGWMNASPQRYPKREDLESLFESCGVSASFTPLRGHTPFENWLVVIKAEACSAA